MPYGPGTQARMRIFSLLVIRIQTIPNHFGDDPFVNLAAFGGLPGVHSIQLIIDEFVNVSV